MYQDETTNNEELVSAAPGFDLSILSPSSLKYIAKTCDADTTNAIITAARANNHTKAAIVAALSQAQLDETVTVLMQRNPRSKAILNLARIADANTGYLLRLIINDVTKKGW